MWRWREPSKEAMPGEHSHPFRSSLIAPEPPVTLGTADTGSHTCGRTLQHQRPSFPTPLPLPPSVRGPPPLPIPFTPHPL